MTAIAGVVLAAGEGTRLRPLTDLRPKSLCPVDNVPLVDNAISHVATVTEAIAVNAWHKSEQIAAHLAGQVHLSIEHPEPLGTAGAIGNLRNWIDGRATLIHNADAWHLASIEDFVADWEGDSVRLLVAPATGRPDFGTYRFCGLSLHPWSVVKQFEAVPSGLWERCWANLWERNLLDLFIYDGPFFDCGTPADYLNANLTASGKDNVVGVGAVVEGVIEKCVVWPGAKVSENERLVSCIRADGVTVQC